MIAIELILLVVSILLIGSIIASKASSSTGVPALLLFLIIGMLTGSEGPGGIYFDNPWVTQSVGVVALTFILFSGGLDTDWQRIRPVLGSGLALANLGVLISTLLVGALAHYALGFSWVEGFLLGAIVSSTDAAAVFSVMRVRSVNLKGNLEPLIEFESGSNDPIAVFLTIGLTSLLTTPGASMLGLVPLFFLQMALGTVGGLVMGWGMTWLVNRLRLNQEGLYPVLTVALMLFTYGATTALGGNGFLAVYIAGIMMGNRDFIHKRSLMRFHDSMAWIMQIAMFLTLGLQVYPSQLLPVIGAGLLVSAFLIFVARPLSVFGALAFTRIGVAAKLMVAWAGLRGAVPIVMATFPLMAGLPRADLIFNLVFFIVLTSVLLQGTTIALAARWLGVNATRHFEYHYPLEFVPHITARSQLMELAITANSAAVGRSIIDLRLPRGTLVVSIIRGEEDVVPNGGTVLAAGDRMLVLAERESLPAIRELVQRGTVWPETLT